MKTRLLFGAMTVAGLLGVSVAGAQTLNTKFIDISPALDVTGTVDGGNQRDLFVGVMNFDSFQGFCVEPLAGMTYGQNYTYELATAPAVLPRADFVNRLITAYNESPQSARDAAAIQWAIWEVIIEDDANFSLSNGQGKVSISSALEVATLANSYLANLASYQPASTSYLISANGQDVITIPEPSAFLMALLSSAVLFRRRRC